MRMTSMAHSMNPDRNFIRLIEEAASVSNDSGVRDLLCRLTIIYELNAVAYVAVNLLGSALAGTAGVDRYVTSTYPAQWIKPTGRRSRSRSPPTSVVSSPMRACLKFRTRRGCVWALSADMASRS